MGEGAMSGPATREATPMEAAETPGGWVVRRWFTPSGAAVAELRPGVEAMQVFERLARGTHPIFLDSALTDAGGPVTGPRLGRHSFVAVDPIHSVRLDPAEAGRIPQSLASLRELLADLACQTIPGLPPFQGGVAGLVSYDCGRERLAVASSAIAATDVPLLSLHVYDVVCGFDHDLGRGWIVSQGLPAKGPAARRTRATERLEGVLARLSAPAGEPADADPASAVPAKLPAGARHPLPGHDGVFSNHTRDSYLDMVRAGIEFVRAGDIFQVNLAQRLAVAATVDPIALYARARTTNPAPFAGCFDAGGAWIASMSPERFLQVERGTVRMHPIKGTRRVLASPEADLYAGDDLGGSAKDRAENVMIVDLIRNDLSRVCTPGSVRVESLCRLERYRYVQHLVSIVSGRLQRGLGPLDALEASIPGGSVTGAPKHRACEIIDRLEGLARGGYCGSLGYVGFDGTADFNLLIRTFVVSDGAIEFSVGGGITAASDPAAEYDETLHKAEGLLRVIAALGRAKGPAEAAR
jgi:para-aminobenzoate synthetase component 1